jgi:hypothetical protein
VVIVQIKFLQLLQSANTVRQRQFTIIASFNWRNWPRSLKWRLLLFGWPSCSPLSLKAQVKAAING